MSTRLEAREVRLALLEEGAHRLLRFRRGEALDEDAALLGDLLLHRVGVRRFHQALGEADRFRWQLGEHRGRLCGARRISKKRQLGDFAPIGRLRKSGRSLPAVKQSLAPWISTARTSRSASAAASASAICTYISVVIAFFLSSRASSMRATLSLVSARTKLVILHLLAQRELGELAGRGVRQLLHEHDVVGHPPLGDLALVELEQLVARHLLPRLLHRHDDRPLVPFRMLDADYRGLGDRRMRDGDVLEVDRADPLAARLDHVLRAVGDLDVAVGIDGADITRGEPLVAQRIAALALEIALDDPRPAHLQVAEGLAVPRQLLAVLADDAQVDAEQRAALLALQLA